jgi:hypothetical protein
MIFLTRRYDMSEIMNIKWKMEKDSPEHYIYDEMKMMDIWVGKLSKRFLMQLPEGMYLVSMTLNPDCSARFEEYVSPPSEREEQWKRIKKKGVDRRKCKIFRSKEISDECVVDFARRHYSHEADVY